VNAMEDDATNLLDLAKLQECADPFESTVWHGMESPLTREEVALAIAEGRLLAEPHPDYSFGLCGKEWGRQEHIERVAYLVVNPSPEPIWIDVGCEALGLYVSWIIQDGNHRLAAALYRGDTTIRVSASVPRRGRQPSSLVKSSCSSFNTTTGCLGKRATPTGAARNAARPGVALGSPPA